MGSILLLILGIILIIVGIIGCVLPIIPGPPISFLGMLVLRFTRFVSPDQVKAYDNLLWIFAFVALVVTVLDYVVPVWGTKKLGGSKAGMWGATLGVLIGLFFVPIGLIVGPFLGAFIGEMMTGKDEKTSLKAGFGSFLGFLMAVGLKLTSSFIMAFYFFKEVLT